MISLKCFGGKISARDPVIVSVPTNGSIAECREKFDSAIGSDSSTMSFHPLRGKEILSALSPKDSFESQGIQNKSFLMMRAVRTPMTTATGAAPAQPVETPPQPPNEVTPPRPQPTKGSSPPPPQAAKGIPPPPPQPVKRPSPQTSEVPQPPAPQPKKGSSPPPPQAAKGIPPPPPQPVKRPSPQTSEVPQPPAPQPRKGSSPPPPQAAKGIPPPPPQPVKRPSPQTSEVPQPPAPQPKKGSSPPPPQASKGIPPPPQPVKRAPPQPTNEVQEQQQTQEADQAQYLSLETVRRIEEQMRNALATTEGRLQSSVNLISSNVQHQLEQATLAMRDSATQAEQKRLERVELLVGREDILASEHRNTFDAWSSNWTHARESFSQQANRLREEAASLEAQLAERRRLRESLDQTTEVGAARMIHESFVRSVQELRGESPSVATTESQQMSLQPATKVNRTLVNSTVESVVDAALKLAQMNYCSSSDVINAFSDRFPELILGLEHAVKARETSYLGPLTQFLTVRRPDLVPAAKLIAWLFEGREAEFCEKIALESVGRTEPVALTWIAVVGASGGTFYHCALTGHSQARKPKMFAEMDAPQFVEYQCSVHPPTLSRMDPNPSPLESTEGNRALLRAKVAAHFILYEPQLWPRLGTLMKTFAFREGELWEFLESRR